MTLERCLVKRRAVCANQPLRHRNAIRRGLVEVDQHSAGKFIPGEAADLGALVKPVLEQLVRLELDSHRLVDLPPQQLVALLASSEEGFGERHVTNIRRM